MDKFAFALLVVVTIAYALVSYGVLDIVPAVVAALSALALLAVSAKFLMAR